MASIKSQMVLNDGMSAVLGKITSALNITLNAFEQVQRASGRAIDDVSISQARSALVGVNAEVSELAAEYSRAAAEEERLNQGIRRGTVAADGMLGKIKGIATTLGAAIGLNKLTDLSDQQASNTARLGLIVDDGGSVMELERRIMVSAHRSRAYYMNMAAAVAKLGLTAGDAFGSNDEIVAFAELLNKNLTIGGASATEQAAAVYQLTQAMASGRLQGDEYRSIIENAPLLANVIEDYMRNVRGAEGSMKDWASQGLLTANVIKGAMFAAADETNERFAQMPLTWGQVWTKASNIALAGLKPVLGGINWLANNIRTVAPLVMGLSGAFAVFQIAANWTQIAGVATKTYSAAVTFLRVGFMMLTGSTEAASAAQAAYNSTLLASPVTWVIMGAMALIGLLYGTVAAYNKSADASVSATGIIGGSFAALGAFLINTFIAPVYNAFAVFAGVLLNIFDNPIAAIKLGFYDLGITVLGWIKQIVDAVEGLINMLPGVEKDYAVGLDNLYNGLQDKRQMLVEAEGLRTVEHIGYLDYGDAVGVGYKLGEGLAGKAADLFGIGGLKTDGSSTDSFDLDQLLADTGNIASGIGGMADALDVSSEQLEYLRDIAEREAINRFTTAEVKIDMTGMTNRIDSTVDLDGVLSTLTDGFAEALATAAEGVHQ